MRQSGLTLLEMLVTLTIAAVLLFLGVPTFINFTDNNQIITSTNNFVADITLARSEAVRRSTMVSICRFNTENACTTGGTCVCGNTASTRYEDGYIIYANPDQDAVKDPGEEVILVAQPADDGITIRGSTNGDRRFSFIADGTLDPVDLPNPTDTQTAHVVCQEASNSVETPCRVINVRATGQTFSRLLDGTDSPAPNNYRTD